MLAAFLLCGSQLDTDSLAHRMWARQLLETGSLRISEDGVFDDISIYYPNTVPKPFQLLAAVAGEAAGDPAPSLAALAWGFFALSAAAALARNLSGGDRWCIWLSTAVLGSSPVFVSAVLRGNPSVVMLGLLFVAGAASGRRRWIPILLVPLVRPEGIFYSAWFMLREKRFGMLPLLLVPLSAWPILNSAAAGSPIWSVVEVRYVVEAMAYRSPGMVAFLPWLVLRGLLTVGPLLAAALLVTGWNRWTWGLPVLANVLMLWLSLGAGSLVLPRYLDHMFLLMVPWGVSALARTWSRARTTRLLAAAVVLVGVTLPWPGTLREIRFEKDLAAELDELALAGWSGRLAVNELLVPRIALSADTEDPSADFLALDRAAWEALPPESLRALGVDRIAVVDHPLYLPEHTREYLDTLEGIAIDTLLKGDL